MLVKIFLDGLILSVMSGMIGSVYIGVLSQEPAFSFWWEFGARFENRWFFKPIWSCEKCFSGQFCLWFYLFRSLSVQKIDSLPRFLPFPWLKISFTDFSLLGLIFSISAAILFASVFTKILNKTK